MGQLASVALDAERPNAAIIHSGSDASYVNVYSWVWDNVVECHTAAAGIPFLGCPDTNRTSFMALERPWIGCA